jgi:hypothetical protein
MTDQPPAARKTIKVENLGDVVALVNQIGEGIDDGSMTEAVARIKQGNAKIFCKIGDLMIQNQRLNRGKRPEKEIRLISGPAPEDLICGTCNTQIAGAKFCSNCGTPTGKK